MSMPKVSVIVATYKAEPYIERCARSLFGQTLDDMEFIFVDDCSPDRSIEVMQRVLEEYPARREQVKVIRHEENRGVSRTRQDGLDAATGDYIIHCDPDDWVDLDMYQTLYSAATTHNADITLCDFHGSYKTAIPGRNYEFIELLEAMTGISNIRGIYGGPCDKLIRRYIAKSGVFPDNVSNFEDGNYLCQILRNPGKWIYLNREFYHYDNNPDSVSKQCNLEAINKDYENILLLQSYKNNDERYNRCIDNFSYLISTRAFFSNRLQGKDFRKRYKKFLTFGKENYHTTAMVRLGMFLSIMGMNGLGLSLYNLRVKSIKFLRKYENH